MDSNRNAEITAGLIARHLPELFQAGLGDCAQSFLLGQLSLSCGSG